MRHRRKRSLKWLTGYRNAVLKNLAIDLILREHIETSVVNAKALREFIEPLLRRASHQEARVRQLLFATLGHRSAVAKLIRDLGPRFASRRGGYLSILKTSTRRGDQNERALVHFV
ncbi:MAG: 50S ribosomal protein L17 [Parcubacteria group bacterium]|nr:50S ribosomal protein L17 [Parcubacteria group bacterium]